MVGKYSLIILYVLVNAADMSICILSYAALEARFSCKYKLHHLIAQGLASRGVVGGSVRQMVHFSRSLDVRRSTDTPTLGGVLLGDDSQRSRVVEEDKPAVCLHSAAFSVQSVEGKTETFQTAGGVRRASTPGDQASGAMLTLG